MKLDITPLLSGKTRNLPFEFELDGSGENATLPPFGTELTSPVRVRGAISDSGTCLYLRLDAEADYKARCDRCADPISGVVSTHIERMVAERGIVEDEESDDYFIASEGILDLDADVSEELMLAFPSRNLCSPDCRGICPVCGQNLNRGDCGCAEREKAETDPRWSSLGAILSAEREKNGGANGDANEGSEDGGKDDGKK